MSGSLHLNRLLGVGLCALLVCACGDSEKPNEGKAGDHRDGGGDGDGDVKGDGDSDVDSGSKGPGSSDEDGGDSAPNQPETDGAAQNDDDAGTGEGDSDGGEPQKTPGTLLNLPHGGAKLSICYGAGDCNGDDLLCYATAGTAPGYCTDDCKKDSDCAAVEGIAATCSSNGQCRLDCAGKGSGDGPCPTNMECRDVSDLPGTGIGALYSCVYPADGGSNSAKLYEKCDRDHGDGDCQGKLSCHTPTAPLNAVSGPGYCVGTCGKAADCQVPGGTTSVPLCTEGACEFDCGGSGATCPEGMNCRDVDSSPISEAWRCRFID
jgi:hypothetical protein